MTRRVPLVPITCKKCRRVIVETLAGSAAYCPRCKTWSQATAKTG